MLNFFLDKYYLYYLGWNLATTVPWRNFIGLAVSLNLDGPFEKISNVPILDRSAIDPFSLSYPFVQPSLNKWTMHYGSNLSWGKDREDMHHVIKTAHSPDGLSWHPTGKLALSMDKNKEIAVSRPWIHNVDGKEKLFFCYRKDRYRIRYGRSRFHNTTNNIGL